MSTLKKMEEGFKITYCGAWETYHICMECEAANYTSSMVCGTCGHPGSDWEDRRTRAKPVQEIHGWPPGFPWYKKILNDPRRRYRLRSE